MSYALVSWILLSEAAVAGSLLNLKAAEVL